MDLEKLFQQAVDHRESHRCSAPPYEHYQKLVEAVNQYHAKRILEIGTGIGFTSTAMALQNSEIHIDTIEKNPEHVELAKKFFAENKVSDQITIHATEAEYQLDQLPPEYDFIFFDGFQVHYEFLPHYQRLLKPAGILFLANNQLSSKTSDKFFDELNNSGKWKILERFADTTIAKRQ